MPVWPETLPASPLMDRYQETPPETVLRSQMDQGPAKLRQRTTAGVSKISVSYVLDAEQVDDLNEFYTSDVSGGALAFDYTHPRTGAMVSCRFRTPPEYMPLNGLYYVVRMALEILP